MKIEYRIFLVIAVFFAVVAVFYGVWSEWAEPVGPVALGLCSLLGAMIAYYLWFTGRKLPFRPEDNPYGEIHEQEGEYGTFSPHSWWPLFLGLTAALCFLGLAVGWWLFIIGATFGVFAVVGWSFEYFKGAYSH